MTDTSGATAIEYALIVTIISIAILTAMSAMGTSLLGFFNSVVADLA